MKRIIVIIVLISASLIFLTPSATPAHGNGNGKESRKGHEHLMLPVPPDLPTIPVEIRNESDVFVVLYLNSLCSPRIALRPGESKVIAGCFKLGLRYQGVVIFYTNDAVLERLHIFTSVRPDEPWIFCKLPPGQETCEKQREGKKITELILSLLMWISANTNYAVPAEPEPDLPKVEFKTSDEIFSLIFGKKGREKRPDRQFIGAYDYRNNTIYLSDDLNLEEKIDRGALVHELVHFMQYKNGKKFIGCTAEKEAYSLESKWYKENSLPNPHDEPFLFLVLICDDIQTP